uniref:ATP-dependent RNA helicase n=1 Tax=Timema shepardi TaxID=629360 RepID=A0A7R9FVJ1_TIMSH|nr:unnamed protein product [Timema shepardi]
MFPVAESVNMWSITAHVHNCPPPPPSIKHHWLRAGRGCRYHSFLSLDVASRGLDLPSVDWIVQYTAPCSTSDYVHRVGRTARVGSHGSALLFLAPGEAEFVRNLENRTVRLREQKMESILENLHAYSDHENIAKHGRNAPPFRLEEAATALQLRFETAVMGQQALHNLACKDQHPRNILTIHTSLLQTSEEAIKNGRSHVMVTFDQLLFAKAADMVLSAGPKSPLSRVILHLGVFHLLSYFMGAIGKIMQRSGIESLSETVRAVVLGSLWKLSTAMIFSTGTTLSFPVLFLYVLGARLERLNNQPRMGCL